MSIIRAVAVVALVVVAVPLLAEEMKFGDITPKGCMGPGVREYSAILHHIPWGQSWQQACERTKGNVRGQDRLPDRCDQHALAQWGVWYVVDTSCGVLPVPVPAPVPVPPVPVPPLPTPSVPDRRNRLPRPPRPIVVLPPPITITNNLPSLTNSVTNMLPPITNSATNMLPPASGGVINSAPAGVTPTPLVSQAAASYAEPAGSSAAAATDGPARWGPLTAGACRDGLREYSAELIAIPAGTPWGEACANTAAFVGRQEKRPSTCDAGSRRATWLVLERSCSSR